MEMVERLAYYGVRAVATLYATRPASKGGLGVTMATFGTLLLCWNLVQSLIPVFTGGLSDRYGYKQTIFASTVIKCAGLPGHGVVPQLLGVLRRGDAAGHRHGDLQAGRPGHAHQSHQPPQQLDGLGHLLPDREHRRLDRPADRAADAPAGVEIRLLHQRRRDLLQLPAAADLPRAGQGGAPRPPAAPPRGRREAAQPRRSKRWPNSRSPTSRSTCSSSPSGGSCSRCSGTCCPNTSRTGWTPRRWCSSSSARTARRAGSGSSCSAWTRTGRPSSPRASSTSTPA